MTHQEAAEYAVTLFNNGYNCAESSMLAAARYADVEGKLPSPRIATALGGGFGRAQLSCGILTGGLLAIGLKYGRDDGTQPRDPAYAKGRTYTEAFKKLAGSPDCRDITGIDMNDPAQVEAMRVRTGGAHNAVCTPLMRRAVVALCEVLDGE